VQDLGRRHTGYGVRDEHYDLVAEALMWALDKGLGPDFTPEVKDAWIAVHDPRRHDEGRDTANCSVKLR
jgi:hemoglobin-like flavoprotein